MEPVNSCLSLHAMNTAAMELYLHDVVSLVALLSTLLLAFLVLSALLIGISMPILVTLTCYRANYTPRAVSLSGDTPSKSPSYLASLFRQDCTPKLGPEDMRSFSATWKRIRALEGWRGLFRGTHLLAYAYAMATVISFFVPIGIMFAQALSNQSQEVSASANIGAGLMIFTSLLLFPVDILIRRTIVHPTHLNWAHPCECLKHVLTAQEYKQPWRLFLLPGVTSTCFVRLLISALTSFVAFSLAPPGRFTILTLFYSQETGKGAVIVRWGTWQALLRVLWQCLVWFVQLPLDNIYVRAVTQRSGPSYAAVRGVEQGVPEKEPIVSLRPCYGNDDPAWTHFGASHVEPYTSLVDVLRKIRDEEGNSSLTRGLLYTIMGRPLLM